MSENEPRIVPCLWFDGQAERAAELYTTVFEDAHIDGVVRFNDTIAAVVGDAAGSVMTVEFRIAGQAFVALNGGPHFKPTPAVSFFVNCADAAEVDRLFGALSPGGEILMPLQAYPFSERYAWIQDRFGISWQLMLGERAQKIAPCLMFVGEQCGNAEAAIDHYTSLFPRSETEAIARYGAEHAPNAEGSVMHAIFSLAGHEFRAMDSALEHAFTFSEAVSLQVLCETQEEIDGYWSGLSAGGDPAAQRCGWLKDAYGVSWQVVPGALSGMLRDPDTGKAERVSRAMLQMNKLDVGALREAFEPGSGADSDGPA